VLNAQTAIELLGREGIGHGVVDLNLDEIFEAFVAGKKEVHFEIPEMETV
jgi:hypothetical protein